MLFNFRWNKTRLLTNEKAVVWVEIRFEEDKWISDFKHENFQLHANTWNRWEHSSKNGSRWLQQRKFQCLCSCFRCFSLPVYVLYRHLKKDIYPQSINVLNGNRCHINSPILSSPSARLCLKTFYYNLNFFHLITYSTTLSAKLKLHTKFEIFFQRIFFFNLSKIPDWWKVKVSFELVKGARWFYSIFFL